MAGIIRTLTSALKTSLRRRPLRRLLIESMSFGGLYKTGKDYLQPVLKSAALALPVLAVMEETRRAAVLIGAIYFPLFLLGSLASRSAGAFVRRNRGEESSARRLWWMELGVFVLMGAGIVLEWFPLIILPFVLLAVLQNLWRPILVGRCAHQADPRQMATVLSIESQARSLFVAVMAPLIGWSVDLLMSGPLSGRRFLPLAAVGIVISTLMLITGRRSRQGA